MLNQIFVVAHFRVTVNILKTNFGFGALNNFGTTGRTAKIMIMYGCPVYYIYFSPFLLCY